MKKILYSAILLTLTLSVTQATAQYFQASLVIDQSIPASPKLRFKLKVTGGDLTNFQFDGMEYFVRKPIADGVTTFGAITNNTVNFPGLDVTKGGGGAPFENGYGNDPNPAFTSFYFYGKSVSATTSPMTYTNGVEYEVFSVDISAAGSSNFEFAANNAESLPYYLTLSRKGDPGGQPDYTAISSHGSAVNHLFYGTGLTKSGDFYYQKPGVTLPVNFLSFYAIKSGDNAKLTWTVENDIDNAYFEIQRSIDGRNYKSVAKVNALNNGRTSNTYETADVSLSSLGSQALYYRIKQVDNNGTIIYSSIRNLNLTLSLDAVNLYPNPAKTITKLVWDVQTPGKGTITIRDGIGRQVQTISMDLVKGINQKDINVSALPSGEYTVTLIGSTTKQTIKLSKIN